MEQKFRNFSRLMLLGAVALGTMTGCNKDKPKPEVTGNIPVKLIADIKSASTLKVANDQWSAGDEVGLFMKRAGQALTASGAIYSEADNARMSVASGSLVATPPIMYPETGNVDFIAYYPFAATLGSGFTLPINVAANQTAALPVEVLYSNNRTNQAATASAVTLNFEYSLAKLEVNVTGGANSTLTAADFAAMTVSIEGMYRQATLQLANGTITNPQAKQTMAMRRTSTTAADFEALAIPTDEEITFLFNVAGAIYRHTITQPNYEAGNLYKLNFALDFPEPKVATLLNAVIIKRKENTQNISVDAKPNNDVYLVTEISIEGRGSIKFEYDDLNRITEIQNYRTYVLSYDSEGDLISLKTDWNDAMSTFTKNDNKIIVHNDRNHNAESEILELNAQGLINKWIFESDYLSSTYIYQYQDRNLINLTVDRVYAQENDWEKSGTATATFTYDDKKSPFYHCKTPQWFFLFYFDENQFGIQNNPKTMDSDFYGGCSITYEYMYNENGFPHTRKVIVSEGGEKYDFTETYKYEKKYR